jgi:hypothetical protein
MRVSCSADLGQLMLDAHADRRAGVQGLEAACELIRVPVQFTRGELGDPEAVDVRHAAWVMRAMPALDQTHFSETIPVTTALSAVHAACGKGFMGTRMTYLVGAAPADRSVRLKLLEGRPDWVCVVAWGHHPKGDGQCHKHAGNSTRTSGSALELPAKSNLGWVIRNLPA